MFYTVKALQKTGPQEPFQVVNIERRDPGAHDVVIDIKAAGICHSDIHTIRAEWQEQAATHFPLTVGHEIAGVVSAVGSAVDKFKVGDRVGVGCMVNSCGECSQCRAGHEQYCAQMVGTYNAEDLDGSITQGGYSQKVTVNERFVLTIPDALDFDRAAPLLCAGITTYSPLERWAVTAGQKVAVLGLGGLGHMAVQIAAALGAEVTVLSRSLKKADAALKLGASRTLATTEEGFFDQHRGEFDLILNTVSAPVDLDAYLSLLKPQGVLAMVGAAAEAMEVSAFGLILGSKVLSGSMIGGIAETQRMLDFCAEHDLGAVIEKVSVDQVDAVYDRIVAGDVQFRAVIDTSTFEN